MGMTLQTYGIGPGATPGYPGSPVGGYAAPSGPPTAGGAAAITSPVVSAAGNASTGSAPTVAWVAVLAVIVGIRIMYEMGAKLE